MFDRSSNCQFRLRLRLRLRAYCGDVPAIRATTAVQIGGFAGSASRQDITFGRRATDEVGTRRRVAHEPGYRQRLRHG